MSIPYLQTTLSNVRCGEGTFTSYPFVESGDTATKVYSMACSQLATDYSANQLDLDDAMSSAAGAGVIELPWAADSAAYFVGDTNHQASSGMISFTRTFANIPQSMTIPSGAQFVTFPGISGTYSPGSRKVISGLSMTAGLPGITFTTQTSHGLTSESNVNINASYTVGTDPFVHQVNGNFSVIEYTGDTFRIDVGHYWPEQVTLNYITTQVGATGYGYGSCYAMPLIRTPISKNVSTETRYDYILPGVTPGISSPIDINIPSPFGVVDVLTGSQTDTAKPTFAGPPATKTIPTSFEYQNLVSYQKNIIVESSLQVWAGNILVQTTKTCKAK